MGICLVVCYGGGGVVLPATLPQQIPEFMSDSCAQNIKRSDYREPTEYDKIPFYKP